MTNQDDIWIIDDDPSVRWVLEQAFAGEKISLLSFESADLALDELTHSQPKVIISDIHMPGSDGLVLLDKVKRSYPDIPMIITTAHSDLDSAVASYQGGAFDYLPKPFDIDEAIEMVRRALSSLEVPKPENVIDLPKKTMQMGGLIGEAPAMQKVFRAIGRLSQSSMNVLVIGESGTGKELVAQALHEHSDRADNPFVAINVAAIPKELIESELFGHEKGAFTGASSQRKGRFEQANGGTLFLDEIGDMPGDAQTRLLRVLATGEFYRVGGTQPITVDTRVVAATHQNLLELVEQKAFREDLYHRLNVIRIQLPKLAERQDDILLLAKYFLEQTAKELSVEAKQLDSVAQRFFLSYHWPGNVRQLENTCRWLTVMAPGRIVSVKDLPEDLLAHDEVQEVMKPNQEHWQLAFAQYFSQQINDEVDNPAKNAQDIFSQIMIEEALKFTQNKRVKAAEILGWGRNTLTRKIKELGLDDE